MDLSVTVDNKEINGDSNLGQYFNVVITNNSNDEIENDTVIVTVTVTLNISSSDPSADIEAVKGGEITFDLTFTATQK